jgi:glycerol transport system ATP-binding protein
MVREDVNAILFDEPLTVIDPHMKWELRTQLKQLHREFRHTMIYVTHDQTEALTFADKVVVMYDGRVVQMGTPQELFETPAHTFVGYFIGSPGMNLFDASVTGNRANLQGASVSLGAAYGPIKGRTQIGIRPEYCVLTAGEGLRVTIKRVEDVGRHRLIRAEAAGQPLAIIAPEGMPVAADLTHVSFAPQKINVYADDWRVAPAMGGAV